MLGNLAEAQHEATEGAIVHIRAHALSVETLADQPFWQDNRAWHDTARKLAKQLFLSRGPDAPSLAEFSEVPSERFDQLAANLLAGELNELDAGKAILVAGALQVDRTVAASRLDLGQFDFGTPGSDCPICGFLPVSALILAGNAVQGLRYLVCGLCATEWNRPRIHCVLCGASKDVAYFGIDESGPAVKAEACASCKTYIKLLNRENEPESDPFADDVATLSLDMLMAEEGYQRFGFNPLLIPGE